MITTSKLWEFIYFHKIKFFAVFLYLFIGIIFPKAALASQYDQSSSTGVNTFADNGSEDSFKISNIDESYIINKLSFEIQFSHNVSNELIQSQCPSLEQYFYLVIAISNNHSYVGYYYNPIGNTDKKIVDFDISSIPHSTIDLENAQIRVGQGVGNGYYCGNNNFSVAVSSGDANGEYVSGWQAQSNLSPVVYFNNPNPVNLKTPILIIPGVLGTDIKKGSDLLWANPKMARGFDNFMDPLAFDENLVPTNQDLIIGDVIRSKGVGGFVSHYTDVLINDLTDQGYTEGKDLFTFPYDWRFGVSSSTVDQLSDQIDYILNKTPAGIAANKVNVIAHSTGGLLLKKYIINHPGDSHIDKAVLVGVPNLGAPKALKLLAIGDDFDVAGLDPAEMKKIGLNMPVVYDLAPSQQYFDKNGSYFHVHNPLVDPSNQDKDLNFVDTWQALINTGSANSTAVDNSEKLHTADFDNYDLRSAGVNLYNIVGCKVGTFGNFSVFVNKDGPAIFDFPKITSGDGTVPFISADSLLTDATKTFFVPNVKHGDLLSANGSRQQIVNLLTGSTLNTGGKVLTRGEVGNRPDLCEIKGESINIKSPVGVSATDQDGNYSGLDSDGNIQNNIPGADFEIWGDHKYLFLPTNGGQFYQIKLNGTGTGTFTVDDQSIEGNLVAQTQVFSNLPVTPSLTGQVNIGGEGTTLTLQASPTSSPVVVVPSSVINATQSQDLVSPVSTSTISGFMGQAGYYRSDVDIKLAAQDPIIAGSEEQTSGVLKIQYNLDNSGYQVYNNSSPINVTAEGQHVLSFFSTDRAGNNEPEKTVVFNIDKTAPEFIIQFNPNFQDLEFTASDTNFTGLSTSTLADLTEKGLCIFPAPARPKIIGNDNIITAIDAAGNTSQILFKDKDRKHNLKADIKSITYNGKPADINNNFLHFDWALNKQGNLTMLTQQAQSKKDFNVLAAYSLNKTLITGKDSNGKVNKAVNGLVLLKIATDQGNINWSY